MGWGREGRAEYSSNCVQRTTLLLLDPERELELRQSVLRWPMVQHHRHSYCRRLSEWPEGKDKAALVKCKHSVVLCVTCKAK